jgi:hypothetical protein
MTVKNPGFYGVHVLNSHQSLCCFYCTYYIYLYFLYVHTLLYTHYIGMIYQERVLSVFKEV